MSLYGNDFLIKMVFFVKGIFKCLLIFYVKWWSLGDFSGLFILEWIGLYDLGWL